MRSPRPAAACHAPSLLPSLPVPKPLRSLSRSLARSARSAGDVAQISELDISGALPAAIARFHASYPGCFTREGSKLKLVAGKLSAADKDAVLAAAASEGIAGHGAQARGGTCHYYY